jgi:hypothetical protein
MTLPDMHIPAEVANHAERALPRLRLLSDDDSLLALLAELGLPPRYCGLFGPLAVVSFPDDSFATCPLSGPSDWQAHNSLEAVQLYLAFLEYRPEQATVQ